MRKTGHDKVDSSLLTPGATSPHFSPGPGCGAPGARPGWGRQGAPRCSVLWGSTSEPGPERGALWGPLGPARGRTSREWESPELRDS